MQHICRQIKTPVCVIVRCTCGWQGQVSRNQNALARSAKIGAMWRKHEREANEYEQRKSS